MQYICALTIAGSDSIGGAGIQADIKTMSAFGVYAASAITAVTVQNTTGVFGIESLRPEIVGGQIRAVMDDIAPAAVKIGMVNDSATIHAIADALKPYNNVKIVVDPVMVSTSGSRLMQEDALEVFRTELMPLATLLTPNVPEAEILSGMTIRSTKDMDAAASKISPNTNGDILLKGGHIEGTTKTDVLYHKGEKVSSFNAKTVDTMNTHGTGCTLSSAITANLATGYDIIEAIRRAKEYLYQALEAGKDIEIGKGHGPVNHFFNPKKLIIK